MRAKACKSCKTKFQPDRPFQDACSVPCAIDLIGIRKQKAWKKETRDRKKKLKTKAQWIKDAQNNAFNPYIRKRDEDLPCISCGRMDYEITENYTGGKWDCGHFKTVGGFPELRFHPMNAHKQCKSCNGGSGKYTKKDKSVAINYRQNLIDRIGIEMVEYLEGPHKAQNWTIEDIVGIKQYYKDLIKQLD